VSIDVGRAVSPATVGLAVDAIEAERARKGLQQQQVIAALGITKRAYYDLGSRTRLRLETCGRIAAFLGWPAEQVLRATGHWERLSPFGRMLASAMLRKYLSMRDLARASKIGEDSVLDMLYRIPHRRHHLELVQRLAKVLDLDEEELLKVAGYPLCSDGCGEVVRRVGAAYIFKHRHQVPVTLHCRGGCGKTSIVTRREAVKFPTVEWDGDDATYLCHSCHSAKQARLNGEAQRGIAKPEPWTRDMVRAAKSTKMRVINAVLMYLLRHPTATGDDLRNFAGQVAKRHPTINRAMVGVWWRPYLKVRGYRLKTGRSRVGPKRRKTIEVLMDTWPRDLDGDHARGFWPAALVKVRSLEGGMAPKQSETLRQWWLDQQTPAVT
jgi:transcriptional regulator with XRE-family HTH domain